ncbi:MAG: UvrD-helicase domain-containing protein [Flavobacteriaceae bacterium]|nr:UvrD-helicase domain-containing protein [Flavobacteriaceae bacterium]
MKFFFDLKPSTFHIFDASAGSGKTFTLVKEYLRVLFQSQSKFPFANILAITFTNKAVGEMKARIINSLIAFSSEKIITEPSELFMHLCSELNIDAKTLHKKSKVMLQNIVHNYSAFDVSTIDKFNQKLIRTFAFDLELPINFQVELDTNYMLSKAVDNLISKAGTEMDLTQLLVDFAIEKMDEDKSWDVSYDLNQIAELLIKENDAVYIKMLEEKSLEDFSSLKYSLKNQFSEIEASVQEQAEGLLTFIIEAGLEFSDFSGGSRAYLPNYFKKIIKGDYAIDFETAWIINIEEKPLYPVSSTASNVSDILDEIKPRILEAFYQTKAKIIQLKFLKGIYKNLTPLSVLNALNKEIEALKKDGNLLLISEFNAIVSEHIKSQPAPYIYERIGEKFKHYFIDEFQDTSVLQWENLIPLINNALSGEHSTALIVGDAKQAIYRWRGGKAEQFIALRNKENIPFPIEQDVKTLPQNFRSHKQIVDFNNTLFKHLSSFVFSDDNYKDLYVNSWQNNEKKNDGFVNLKFLSNSDEDDKNEVYPKQVLETINLCLENGFKEQDIAIIVRTHKEGIAITDYLNANSDVRIISSETLLLSRSEEVQFIVNLLQLITQPDNKALKFDIGNYLLSSHITVEDNHEFLSGIIDLGLFKFFNSFKDFGIVFNVSEFIQLPLYEGVELIINNFNLITGSNGQVQYFLDFVLDYSLDHQTSLSDFIEYYDLKKDKLSVTIPDGVDAVTIMTIHKAKGLEFPVVIFPYAEVEIYNQIKPRVWLPVDQDQFQGFSHLLFNFNKDIAYFGDVGAEAFQERLAQLELDAINMLYVTLTRAVEQLYIISRLKINKKGNESLKTFDGLFINYLKAQGLWKDNLSSYSFGNVKRTSINEEAIDSAVIQNTFISTPRNQLDIKIVTKAGLLWDTDQQRAIERGNLIHLIMSYIKTEIDIPFAMNTLFNDGIINTQQKESLQPIIYSLVSHPSLKIYFDPELKVYNERDILVNNAPDQRPDRVTIDKDNFATVLDYKTGNQSQAHEQQIQGYLNALKSLGLHVKKGVLVYINDEIEIKEILPL